MSKALITDASKLEWRPLAELRAKYGVDFREGVKVSGVELGTKEVIIGATQERVPYESLVLATGGVPRRLPIAGKDLSNVFTLRGVEDTKKIDAGETDQSMTAGFVLTHWSCSCEGGQETRRDRVLVHQHGARCRRNEPQARLHRRCWHGGIPLRVNPWQAGRCGFEEGD